MNERIKRLAIHADLITHEVPNGLAHLHTEKDIEKFAELIINDCIEEIMLECQDFQNGNCFANNKLWLSVTQEYDSDKRRDYSPVGIGIHFKNMLKKHFGVK